MNKVTFANIRENRRRREPFLDHLHDLAYHFFHLGPVAHIEIFGRKAVHYEIARYKYRIQLIVIRVLDVF